MACGPVEYWNGLMNLAGFGVGLCGRSWYWDVPVDIAGIGMCSWT